MRLLPKAGRIAEGHVFLNGVDLAALPEEKMRQKRGAEVAMIFQDSLAALDPTMRIGKQMIEPLLVHRGLTKSAAMREAAELLGRVGIPSPRERLASYPHEFSGGMRQRVMIAIALSCNPSLLLADEPTTAVDVTIQRQILDLMNTLKTQMNAGVVIVTHDVGVVAETCDRVIVMYAGRIVESGATEEVFTTPLHPYTTGLLGSSLDLQSNREDPLNAVPGLPPDLINVPPGCPFWPRCSEEIEECRVDDPALLELKPGHYCACHVAAGEHAAAGDPVGGAS
jgi:oligopeptide transport system ATP-binding protein